MNCEGRAFQVAGATRAYALCWGKAFRILRSAKEAGVERVGKRVRKSGRALRAMGVGWDLFKMRWEAPA